LKILLVKLPDVPIVLSVPQFIMIGYLITTKGGYLII